MSGIVNATIWSSLQRFGSLGISFVSNMVLARLLCPEDFGTVAMIMVFVSLADVLVDGGLGNALIQAKDISNKDTSTVFTSNLLISVTLFTIIFIAAPYISSYVGINNFDTYLRVEAVMILIRAFYVVNFSLVNRNLKFKSLAWIGLTANLVATVLAILLAYIGFGIWSLIFRNIIHDIITCILYYIVERAPMVLYVSRQSLKRLLGFGVFVASANLLEMLYTNVLSFVIGKRFSVKELGYYNQAFSLEQIPVYSLTSVLNQVMFPFMSKIQDEKDRIKDNMRKSTMCISFVMFPLMVFLICYAKPIVIVLYSDKWLPSVPFFRILCVIGFFNALYHLNRSVLKAVGKTKQLFYAQVLSVILGFLLIFAVLPLGVFYVVGVVALHQVLSFIIVTIISGRAIGYRVLSQLGDTSVNFCLAVIAAGLSVFISSYIQWNNLLLITVMLIIYVAIYFLLHILLHSKSSSLVFSVITSKVLPQKGK